MKTRKRLMIFLLLLIILPLTLWLFNRFNTSKYNKIYANVENGGSSTNYTLTPLSLPGQKFDFHFSDDHDGASYLYLDTLTNDIVLRVEERDNKYNVRISLEGNVIKEDSAKIPGSCISIKNELKPFQPWTNPSKSIHLAHFSRDEFNTEMLNPLNRLGAINGSLNYYWDGYGYYDIDFKNEKIKVKIPCKCDAILFAKDTDYYTSLHYYQLPQAAFLIREPNSIYIIR